jgi:hypothetical protein
MPESISVPKPNGARQQKKYIKKKEKKLSSLEIFNS